MNSSLPAPRGRRRWPWVVALLCTPVLLLGIAAAQLLTLDRPASVLRQAMLDAEPESIRSTRVQLSVGPILLGAVRIGLRAVPHRDADRARIALSAIRHASVGVYTLEPTAHPDDASAQALREADRIMGNRGWSRLVGVIDAGQSVMLYTPRSDGRGRVLDLCIAVRDGSELVIVSTSVGREALVECIQTFAPLPNRLLGATRPAGSAL